MLRLLALTWSTADEAAGVAARAMAASCDAVAGWRRACDAPGFLVLVAGDTEERERRVRLVFGGDAETLPPSRGIAARGGQAGSPIEPCGLVCGALFDRSGAPVGDFDARTDGAVVASAGAHLVEACWGSWVAILRGPASSGSGAVALRAPVGTLRLFHLCRRGIDLWASDIEDAAHAAGPLALDRATAAAALLHRVLTLNATGLDGVTGILGGQRATVRRDGLALDWPWRPAAGWRESRLDDAGEAASVLRADVETAVRAWAAGRERILHRLSGGLDSSIVLGCLARAEPHPELACLTYFIAPGTVGSAAAPRSLAAALLGDERGYARLAAEAAGAPLLERERRPGAVDLPALLSAHRTARPSWLAFSPDVDRMDVEIVRELGADAVFTGRGGDAMFFAAPGAWPAIDEASERGLRPRLVGHALDAARESGRPAWPILRTAAWRGLLRRCPPHLTAHRGVTRMASADALALAAPERIAPPWSPLIEGLPPGKTEQLHAVFAGNHYAEPFARGRAAAVVDPLLSQPVVESVLRIPAATLAPGGVSRGLARRAFADLLPQQIAARRTKAGGDAFVATVARIHMLFIRELLIGGALERLGLLERGALEAGLQEHLQRGTLGDAILHAVGVECWARSWDG